MILAGLGLGYYAYTHVSRPRRPGGEPPAVVAEAPLPSPPQSTAPPVVFNEEQFEKVRASTNDSDARVRWQAAKFLIDAHDPQAESIVVRMVQHDEDAGIRREAIGVLESRASPQVILVIVAALKDSETNVRLTALQALGRIGDSSTVPAISDSLRDVDEHVRLSALQTLTALQERRNSDLKRIEEDRQRYQQELAEHRKKVEAMRKKQS